MFVRNDACQSELRDVVVEASRALAHLDADSLEELANSCQALNRDLTLVTGWNRAELVRQAKAAEGEMKTFARVLDATRANLDVMRRLREIHLGNRSYEEVAPAGLIEQESLDGHN